MARGGSKPGSAPRKVANKPKKAASTTRDGGTAQQEAGTKPLDLQQKCLDVFRDRLFPSSDDTTTLQEVKGHLFNRNFATAFGKEEYLRVYASRWSPSRALAYLKIFSDVAEHFPASRDDDDVAEMDRCLRIVCLGGGAGGELVGLGAWLSKHGEDTVAIEKRSAQVDLVDIAKWNAVVEQLHAGLTTAPGLSKYASQAKRDANTPLVTATKLSAEFHQLDVLCSDGANAGQLTTLVERADLVTFMFTLNELYSTSLPATQALLNHITKNMKAGSHLLVVDSQGSYSTISFNGAEKKYPMQWLLDHTVLGTKKKGEGEGAKWEKVAEDESRWFRLDNHLRYPIALEDMRFQMHFFRRLEDGE